MERKIAITVKSDDGLSSKLDPRFGRTPFFLVVSRHGDDWAVSDTIRNGAVEQVHGAGGSAAKTMSELGVTDVISGRFGPKAYQALEALEVRMWLAGEGLSANELLTALADGALEEMKVAVF